MNWDDYLRSRGFTDETIGRFHLRYDEARNGIVIPYINKLGVEYGKTVRLLDPGERPKYLRDAGFEATLYNIRDLYETPVFVTEGELDCISLCQAGRYAVGYHGAHTFREEWRWGFVGADVIICADGDSEGEKAAVKIRRLLRGVANNAKLLLAPAGEDVNSLMIKGELEQWIASSN